MPTYPEQPSYIRIGSSWKTIEQVFIYKSGAWKRVNQAYIYSSGQWKRFYAYDSIAPTLTRFNLSGTTSGLTYGSEKTSASYVIEFSEPILNWDETMVTFSSNPGSAWEIDSVTNPSNDDKTYIVDIVLTGTQTSGTVTLEVDPTGVTDESGINEWSGSPLQSQSFSIDVTKPAISQFNSSSLSTDTTVVFTLRFSETITGNILSNLTIGGTSTGWQIAGVSGSGQNYSVTLTETSTGSTTAGSLTLTLNDNVVTDALGNTGPASDTTSSEFTVARTPPVPSISAISSVNTTLHDRRIDFTVSVSAGLTTVKEVIAYLYDSNDNYTGSSLTIDVTDTTAAFTTTGSFSVGRNPGTKYFVRAQTKNTFNLTSALSTRSEITTGSDLRPPVLAAPTVTANTPANPGWPGVAVVRSLSYSFASPSSYLTSEVAKVTVYCIRSSDGHQMGSAEHLKGAGWGAGALTGTFGSLAASTNYYIYATSADIYGGANSTNDSSATTTTTTAAQTGSDTVYYGAWGWGPEGADSAYTAQTGLFDVTGNSFSQTSTYAIPGVNTPTAYGQRQYKIDALTIGAYTGSSGTTICTSSRYFRVDFSGTSTSAGTGGGTRNGLSAPWNNNSGTTERQDGMSITAVGYGNAGAGRIRVRGDGSIGTWSTSPDQRIYVRVYISGRQQEWTQYSYGRSWTY
jgi:hypothetical protein